MIRLIGHLVAATGRHSSEKVSLHPDAIQIKRHGEIRQTCETYWRTNLTTLGPNTADGLPRRSAMMRPDTEAPHTRSASQMKYWIMNSPRGSSLSHYLEKAC